jgi:hypothetical protein
MIGLVFLRRKAADPPESEQQGQQCLTDRNVPWHFQRDDI